MPGDGSNYERRKTLGRRHVRCQWTRLGRNHLGTNNGSGSRALLVMVVFEVSNEMAMSTIRIDTRAPLTTAVLARIASPRPAWRK
jgi:hypothetical protein